MERLADFTEARRRAEARSDFLDTLALLARHPGRPENAVAEAQAKFTGRKIPALVKAAVAAGDTHTPGWSSELSDWFTVSREWVETKSRKTILGKLDYVRVPFQTKVPTIYNVTPVTFVPSGFAIPVTRGQVGSTTTMEHKKVATIFSTTEELAASPAPGARGMLDDMATNALVRGADSEALDPDLSAVAGGRPGSLLSGVSPLGDFSNSATGALADIETLIGALVDAESDLTRVLLVMHPKTCLTLSLMTSSGSRTFPELGATGGSIIKIPVATSVSCMRSSSPNERIVAAIDGARVVVADDGQAEISASRYASLQMSDSPTMDAGTPTAATNVTDMWTTGSIGVRLTRWINFQRADSTAVAWMTSAF